MTCAGLRIGVPTNYFSDHADDAVLAAVDSALAVLAARGASIVRLTVPMMDAVSAYVGIVSRVEGATIHAQWMRGRPADYAVHLSARLYGGNAIPATYYVEALSRRGPILAAFARAVFGAVDVLAMPTIRTVLPTLAATDVDHGPPGTEHAFWALTLNTRPFNYLGLPAVSLPCGFDPNGCPHRPADRRASLCRGKGAEGGRRLPAGYGLARTGAGRLGRQTTAAGQATSSARPMRPIGSGARHQGHLAGETIDRFHRTRLPLTTGNPRR